jgi:hypothetical protein
LKSLCDKIEALKLENKDLTFRFVMKAATRDDSLNSHTEEEDTLRQELYKANIRVRELELQLQQERPPPTPEAATDVDTQPKVLALIEERAIPTNPTVVRELSRLTHDNDRLTREVTGLNREIRRLHMQLEGRESGSAFSGTSGGARSAFSGTSGQGSGQGSRSGNISQLAGSRKFAPDESCGSLDGFGVIGSMSKTSGSQASVVLPALRKIPKKAKRKKAPAPNTL